MDDLEEDDVCGLDLGTTFSCIGVYRNGGVEIIPNRYGDKTTPSIVTIIDKDTLLRGEETLDNLVKDYDSSIFAVKRFLGRDLEDKEVKEEIQKGNFPFKFVLDEGHPSIEVKKNNETIHYTLEEISSHVIRKMVDSAENFLEKSIDKLVITVPSNFNDAQRKCTEQAAEIAGVKVLRFINEPTAAALAYRLDEKNKDNNGKILIFDLGGGTFDVTLLTINNNLDNKEIFNVLSSKGEKFLGGEDFDNILVEFFLNNFCEKMNLEKEDVKKDKKAIRKLKISCEKIKRVLNSNRETQLYIHNFYDNKDILEKITESKFNTLCKNLVEKLRKPLDEAISDAKISKKDISEIVLVGGSTRLPMVRIFIARYFKDCNIKINDSINPDEAIAYGATLMAAKISKKKIGILSDFNLMDITPLSLGIETQNNSKDSKIRDRGKLMSVIIKRGVTIPYSNTERYTTTQDYQNKALIAIIEGEKNISKKSIN
jgi:L1 cell adhesion molecule like protein